MNATEIKQEIENKTNELIALDKEIQKKIKQLDIEREGVERSAEYKSILKSLKEEQKKVYAFDTDLRELRSDIIFSYTGLPGGHYGNIEAEKVDFDKLSPELVRALKKTTDMKLLTRRFQLELIEKVLFQVYQNDPKKKELEDKRKEHTQARDMLSDKLTLQLENKLEPIKKEYDKLYYGIHKAKKELQDLRFELSSMNELNLNKDMSSMNTYEKKRLLIEIREELTSYKHITRVYTALKQEEASKV